MIAVSHLTKTYGTKRAVDDVSSTAPAGSVTGFLGPNGAGKATTRRSLRVPRAEHDARHVVGAGLVGPPQRDHGGDHEPHAAAAGKRGDWTASTIAKALVTPGVIVAIHTARQATGEWSSGQLRVSFATVPRRDLWLAATSFALALFCLVAYDSARPPLP
jgi:hypothetical protein